MEKIDVDTFINYLFNDLYFKNYRIVLPINKLNLLKSSLLNSNLNMQEVYDLVNSFIKNYGVCYSIKDCDSLNSDSIYNILKNYRHKINLFGIKSDLKYTFGEKSKIIYLNWHNKQGISVDTLVQELSNYGLYFNSLNTADLFIEFINLYDNVKQNKIVDDECLSTFSDLQKKYGALVDYFLDKKIKKTITYIEQYNMSF